MQSAANLKPLNDLPPIVHGNSRSRANLLPSLGSSALTGERNPSNDPIRALSSKNMSPMAGLGNSKQQMDDDFYSQKTGVVGEVNEVRALMGNQGSMADMTTQGVSAIAADKSTISPRQQEVGSKMTAIGIKDTKGINYGATIDTKKDDYEDLLDDIEKDFGGIGFDTENKSIASKKQSITVKSNVTREVFDGESFDPRTMGDKPGDNLVVDSFGYKN